MKASTSADLFFEQLWLPVLLVTLAVTVIAGGGSLALRLAGLLRPWRDAALARTRIHPGAHAVLILALGLAVVSQLAHGEAVRRCAEQHAAFIADLDGEPQPIVGPARFHEDWRQTAHLSRTLFLYSALGFVAWLVLCAWFSARALATRRQEPKAVVG